jgi:hypothetical protein
MSDTDLLKVLERMESWLQGVDRLPGPDALVEWNREFQAALASAERGPGWSILVERAHALGVCVNVRAATLGVQRDQIHRNLKMQECGGRALKGYKASVR